jgi:hypothetical protein
MGLSSQRRREPFYLPTSHERKALRKVDRWRNPQGTQHMYEHLLKLYSKVNHNKLYYRNTALFG